MKEIKFLFFLTLCLFIESLCAQWEISNIPYSSSNANTYISEPAFPTADVGYIIASAYVGGYGYGYAKLFKTTNKGGSWSNVWDITAYSLANFGIHFLNINTGFIVRMTSTSPYIIYTYKTTDAGYTWNTIGQITGITYQVNDLAVIFVNSSTGYLWNGLNVYKTSNGGYNWSAILNGPTNGFSVITGVTGSKIDNTIYIGGARALPPNDNPVLFRSTNGGVNFTVIEDGYNNNSDVQGIHSLSLANNTILFAGAKGGLGKLVDNELILASNIYSGRLKNIACFTSNNYGVMYGENNIDNGIATTTDAGNTWAVNELDLNYSKIIGFTNVGDVICGSYFDPTMLFNTQRLFVAYRKIGVILNSNFDWQSNTYSGGFYADGQFFETQNLNAEIRGGTINVSLPDYNRFKTSGSDTVASFYYWGGTTGNGSMNWQNNSYYAVNKTDEINADYKQHLRSSTPSAISNVSQLKSLIDTN